MIVDLSHPLRPGERTYSWMPATAMHEFLSRQASRERYAAGTEFVIHQFEVMGNSGTYLDAPLHRHAEGADLASLPIERLVHLPATVIDARAVGHAAIPAASIADLEPAGHAVLFWTGTDVDWGRQSYSEAAPYIDEELARALVEAGVWLVGIDAQNVDDQRGGTRPAHTVLLGAGIPIVENLTGLERLPESGCRFSAAPVAMVGGSAFPVRAFAVI